MSDQELEINLGTLLMAILKRYGMVEVNPQDLVDEVTGDYQLAVTLNEETEMFEITLEGIDES